MDYRVCMGMIGRASFNFVARRYHNRNSMIITVGKGNIKFYYRKRPICYASARGHLMRCGTVYGTMVVSAAAAASSWRKQLGSRYQVGDFSLCHDNVIVPLATEWSQYVYDLPAQLGESDSSSSRYWHITNIANATTMSSHC